MNPFVFLVGCARSGTTLLERLADAHPVLAVTHGTRWIVRLYQDGAGLTDDGRVTRQFIEQLIAHPRFKTMAMNVPDVQRLHASRPGAPYAEFVTALFDLYGMRRGKRYVGDRSPEYVRSVPLLHDLWPAARFVHIIRDGRDVWLSVADWQKGATHLPTWGADPVSTTAVWWERNVRLAREAGAALGPQLYHELRYESLVADPVAECTRLCQFLGFPFDDRMLRFHEGRTRDLPGLDAKKSWRPVTAGLRDWRSQMSLDEVGRFEAVAGGLLDELGYPRAATALRQDQLDYATRIRDLCAADERNNGRPVPTAWAATA